MARTGARAAGATPTLARVKDDVERPRSPLSLRVVGLVALGLLAWLLFGSALSVARAFVALAGYVIVALGAYTVGKWVGRRSQPR